MNYKLISDSCTDYVVHGPDDMPWLFRAPLSIHLGDKVYVDDMNLDTEQFVREMGACPTAPRSACPAPEHYLSAFGGPEEDIYVVTLSAELSGSYNSAMQAARIYREDTQLKNIHVFNSKSAAAGQVAICLKIRELAESGLPFHEVVRQGEQYISDLETFFVLEDLEVFRKNGRLGALQSVITGKLKIKLVMSATPEGSICRRGQAMSIQQALNKMINMVAQQAQKTENTINRLVVSHCAAPERAQYVLDTVKQRCKVIEGVICRTSGISSMYAGPGGVVVSF